MADIRGLPVERVIVHKGLRAIIQYDHDVSGWTWTFAFSQVMFGTAPDLGTAEQDVKREMERIAASGDVRSFEIDGAASSQRDDD